MKNKKEQSVESYIPASTKLPEITVKAVLLGIILSILMAGANAYLGLKIGLSVSACIPAAVISMAVLKAFRNSNILENNIVQTTASAGEVVASALAFTIPALVMIGYWNEFPYYILVCVTMVGGLLGVLFSVPLRRAMIIEGDLKFPEGVATAEVLKAEAEKSGAKVIFVAGLIAAVIKFCQTGFQFLADSINIWGRVGNTVMGVTSGFSLALVGAGYIIGLQLAFATFSGGILAWFIGVPLYGALFGLPVDAPDAYTAAVGIWNSKIRIIGAGMMVFGGVWMLVELFTPLRRAISSSLEAMKKIKSEGKQSILRTDFDIPILYVGIGLVLLVIPVYFIFSHIVGGSGLGLTSGMLMSACIFITFLALILAAMGSSISSYMCGLLGSSTNPISGITLIAILIISLSLFAFLRVHVDFSIDADAALNAAGVTVLIGALVACATAVGGDNLQDLKSGQLVGSTPWKQQIMLGVGVIASSLILAPIFQLLFEAYGFGDVMPRDGMDPTQALSAPKAAIMASISQAIFTQSMDWTMVIIGVGLGIIVVIVDKMLKKAESKWRFPILAVAVGMYMPLVVTAPVMIGGIIAALSQKTLSKSKANAQTKAKIERRGILFASGLIAGEAIVGILLAIPFVIYQSTNVFRVVPDALKDSTDVLGVIVSLGVFLWFYNVASKTK